MAGIVFTKRIFRTTGSAGRIATSLPWFGLLVCSVWLAACSSSEEEAGNTPVNTAPTRTATATGTHVPAGETATTGANPNPTEPNPTEPNAIEPNPAAQNNPPSPRECIEPVDY